MGGSANIRQPVTFGNDGKRRQRGHDGVAVGLGTRDVGVPDPASSSALVLDDDPLSQRVGEMGGERAGRVVGYAARRKRHHDGNRARWKGLRVRDSGPGRYRAGDECNELAAPHALSSLRGITSYRIAIGMRVAHHRKNWSSMAEIGQNQ
jgi:hypothetical protein